MRPRIDFILPIDIWEDRPTDRYYGWSNPRVILSDDLLVDLRPIARERTLTAQQIYIDSSHPDKHKYRSVSY